MMVTLDFAIPLGLLVNELITNCFKHSQQAGCAEICIGLVRNPVGDVLLTVSSVRSDELDTANGPSTTAEFSYQQGQGVEIITGLVDQIDGVMKDPRWQSICDGNHDRYSGRCSQ